MLRSGMVTLVVLIGLAAVLPQLQLDVDTDELNGTKPPRRPRACLQS